MVISRCDRLQGCSNSVVINGITVELAMVIGLGLRGGFTSPRFWQFERLLEHRFLNILKSVLDVQLLLKHLVSFFHRLDQSCGQQGFVVSALRPIRARKEHSEKRGTQGAQVPFMQCDIFATIFGYFWRPRPLIIAPPPLVSSCSSCIASSESHKVVIFLDFNVRLFFYVNMI